MDNNKGIPRSHHAGFESQSTQQSSRRPQRKPPKKSQNVLCDNRTHHVQHHEHIPLFNNRSLSMLSTMHHLNPHRKVAMSPEILREAEEQATSLRKAVKQLQDQLEKANREKARIHRFLSDLLYTLNARGYESVQDHEGTVVDLNKCKGESYLDLKGRDLKQRVNVRRQGGQELLMKAVIGNQERAIQSLVYKLDSIGRDIVLGNRLSIDDTDPSTLHNPHETAKVASLEAEVLQLVNLIEGACQKCPEMYSALREHYYLNEGIKLYRYVPRWGFLFGNQNKTASKSITANEGSDLSPRNPVIHNLLRKCEQISNEAQSKQLVDMLGDSCKSRPRSQPANAPPNNSFATSLMKAAKNRPTSKPKSPTTVGGGAGAGPGVRIARSSPPELGMMSSVNNNNSTPTWPQSDYSNGMSQPSGSVQIEESLKNLSVGSRIDNSFKHKGVSIRFSRPPAGPSVVNDNSNSADPLAPYFGTPYSHGCSVTVCPYCQRKFGLEESISEIKNHIEMHIFAGDTALI